MSIQLIKPRGSQEFSKNIIQSMQQQKENNIPMRSLSPFLSKSHRSRSGSPERVNCNTSFGTVNNSKIDIGNTNIYTKSTNTKCTINKLGLQLRPYCANKDHKRSNVTHLCIADECSVDDASKGIQRLSCQFCILEMHSTHKEACIPIEQFCDYIDTQFLNVTQSFKELNMQSLKLKNPPFLQKVYDSLNVLKLAVCQHIDNQKVQIKQQITSRAEEFIPNLQDRIDNYSILNNKFKDVSSRNIFELNEQEIDILLKFSKEEFIDEMTQFRKKLLNTFNMIEYQTELASNHYQASISNLVQCILKNNDQLILPLKKDIMSIPGNTKMKFLRLQSFILQKKQEEIFKSLKELKNIMSDESTANQSINQTYLTTSDIQNGKLLIYSEQCKHTKQSSCNTVPIFPCCKQAYQCSKCHNQHTMHKAVIAMPSQRLCMKCLCIFTVEYTAEVQINCNSCLDIKQCSEQVATSMMQSLLLEDVKSVQRQRSPSPQLTSPYQSRPRAKSIKEEKNPIKNQQKYNQSQYKKDGRQSPDLVGKNQMFNSFRH